MLLALTLALLAPPAGNPLDSWPQWGGPNRDGAYPDPALAERFPEGGPKVSFRVPAGAGYAGPAVAGGRVYIHERQNAPDAATPSNAFDTKTVVVGQERVRCLDSRSGKEIWAHAYDAPYKLSYASGPRCTPTVDVEGGKVYTLGAMGDLLCLNLADGKVVWGKNLPKEFGASLPVWGYAAHPLLDGDSLICLVGGSEGRLVVAFNKATGAVNWKSQSFDSGDFGYNPPVIHTLGGVRTLLVWHPKAVVGLDPSTGERFWGVPIAIKAALNAPMLRVQSNRVFGTSFYEGSFLIEVAAGGRDAKLVWKSAAKGEKPNQTRDLSSIITTPVWVGDSIYGVDSYGEMRCIEAGTGKRVWASQLATRGRLTPANVNGRDEPSEVAPWSERWACAFITPTGNDLYILFNEQGELIRARLTPAGYEELGRAAVAEPTNKLAGRPVIWSHPAYAEGAAFVKSDTELVRVELRK